MDFVDATYIAPAGGVGRAKEPNPYNDVIDAIALKRVDSKGKVYSPDDEGYAKLKPLAKGFLMNDDETLKATVSKAKRQLADAGKQNTPAVSITSKTGPALDAKGKPVAGKVLFSFWTGPQQKRARQAEAVETAPEGTK